MDKQKHAWLALFLSAAAMSMACSDNTVSNVSDASCITNEDCKDADKPICNLETGKCEAEATGACAEECEEHQQCIDGKCVDSQPKCTSDADCTDADKPDCHVETGVCQASPDPNACPEGCPENQKCIEGKCVDGNPCAGMDCEDGKACIAIQSTGMCVDVECVQDNALMACEAGKVCQKGECVFEACAKIFCSQGKICQEDGSCQFDSAPALIVESIENKETSEDGSDVKLKIKLNHEPAGDVSLKCDIETASPNPEATAVCDIVRFNPEHWNEPQDIMLYGVADSIVDGDQAYTLKISTIAEDAEFNGLSFSESFVNRDTDKAEFIVSRTELQTSESGDSASFTIELRSKPAANITLTLSSSHPNFGILDKAEENSLTLTFTPETWNIPQTVTVIGVEDDGTRNKMPNSYTINFEKSVSEDPHYHDLQLNPIQVVNMDNDKAEAFISVVHNQPCGIITPEDGKEPEIVDDPECVNGYKEIELDREFDENNILVVRTNETDVVANLRLKLGIAPNMPVELNITAWDDMNATRQTEAETEAVFSTQKLVLTKDNYKLGELLKIAGKPDQTIDKDQTYYTRISFSSEDEEYNSLEPIWIKCINANTDQFSFVKTTESIHSVDEDSETNPEKHAVEYQISFACNPQDTVAVTFAPEDDTELTVSPAAMTFTAENWNTPQTLTIHGKIDNIIDGDVVSKLRLVAKGETTEMVANDEIELTTVDINTAAIHIDAVGGTYREGATDTIEFSVWLSAKPEKNSVIANVVSSNPSALSITEGSALTFTPTNWNVPQKVKMKVGADVEVTEYVRVNITSVSSDKFFKKLTTVTPDYVILDISGAAVSLSSSKTTLKPGDYTSTVDVSLSRDPMGTLTVTLSTTNDKTAAIEPKILTFTSENWDMTQTVQVKTVDPDSAVSAKSVETISAVTSNSGPYEAVKPNKDLNFTIYQFMEKAFEYTGDVQTIDLKPGKYLFEVWGAQGSNAFSTGGLGGYASGEMTVTQANMGTWYVYVGGQSNTSTGGWNGGGGGNHTGGAAVYRGAGGGGTDIRTQKGDLKTRVIVAGGGGGGINYCNVPRPGAYGGGLASGPLTRVFCGRTQSSINVGADQTGVYVNQDPGVVCTTSVLPVTVSPGALGQGAQSGGGGYWGGASFGQCNLIYAGSGGSGYIDGVQNGQMKGGIRSGHGSAKITIAE